MFAFRHYAVFVKLAAAAAAAAAVVAAAVGSAYCLRPDADNSLSS